jgi:hypothetical protein
MARRADDVLLSFDLPCSGSPRGFQQVGVDRQGADALGRCGEDCIRHRRSNAAVAISILSADALAAGTIGSVLVFMLLNQ